MIDNFIHLHVHDEGSNKRLLDSTIKVKDMVLHVANVLGQKGVALTNHEIVGGHIEFMQVVEELKEDGKIPLDFKVILGNEIYLTDPSVQEDMENNTYVKFYHILLLAKNKEGHKQLRELSTRAWVRMRNFRGMERVPTYYEDIEEIVGQNKGNIIGSTACLGSRFASLVTQLVQVQKAKEKGLIRPSLMEIGKNTWGEEKEVALSEEEFDNIIMVVKEAIHEFIEWCISIFGEEDFYIELQPSLPNEDGTPTEQQEYNEYALHIAKAYGLKPILTTDAHYLTVEDRPVHEAFLTSDEDGNSNREVASFYGTTHFFSSKELHDNLFYLSSDVIDKMIMNTKEIADKVEDYSLAHNQVIPKIPIEDDETKWFEGYNIARVRDMYMKLNKYENVSKMIKSDSVYDRYLVAQCVKGLWGRKIPREDYEEYLSRMDIECWAILGVSEAKNEPISSYFITMQKIIDIIWDTGSFVGTGRGSAGCFLINYLLQIVQINPLRQGVVLEYWRFLHPSKIEIPKLYWGLRMNLA